ncbi:cytochrome c oxidase assembly factor 1 family protein [Neorhodopirellula lusitana]|uniref:cytochrome c oxidase assembly factor 1 family protein n=1 Tax=Neorhodopirellula lusitana TaxID=445327 RepID=UPI00384C23D9
MSQVPVIDPFQGSPSQQQEPKKSRTGCIVLGVGGGCLIALLICGGIITTGVVGVFALIKSSEPYTESLAKAQTNVELKSTIGDPIEPSVIVQGNINLENDGGDADLNYSVSGPNGTATVHVTGTKSGGAWNYSRMDATTQAGTKIDLLDEPPSDNVIEAND